jgi:hypothetical protein
VTLIRLRGHLPNDLHTPFPAYTVCDGIASITLKARNGFVHSLRVPADALALLKRCWPFEVTTGGKRKKVVKQVGNRRVPLHQIWLMVVHDLASPFDFALKPKCKNHDWLDWTNGNVYIPGGSQEGFENRIAYLSGILSERAKEIVGVRQLGSGHSGQVCLSEDPEIVAIFDEAQDVPRPSARPRGYGPHRDLDPSHDAADS